MKTALLTLATLLLAPLAVLTAADEPKLRVSGAVPRLIHNDDGFNLPMSGGAT